MKKLALMVAAAATVPARAIGQEGAYGALELGCAADFTLLDDALRVSEVWVGGARVTPA